ncbi:PREDICTED: interferon-induced protein with tetratricopeptide repeats 2-like [Cyprinodon variegatus]|uniref:interferon-induced protein with tetratricopeptide repeats 2-like n=1 Tax=Cyprinodon variegatus TaxID=28743 RepID=UPI0007427F89|nr:PREDICTED: interferon-induced protein with tetratricopeptide repeats 2-like [Cyprinodon variegatus]
MSPSTEALESKLEALQCHFTWDLEPTKSKLNNLRYALEDIGTDEGNVWLGHISNLQGFIQYKLGSSEEALSIFRRANETFQRLKNSDEGPWLIVNFGNLAWLNHLMGEDKKSQDYLSKVEALIREYPAPPEEELYSEVCAEKAWTISRFDKEKKLQAAELFQKAVMMHPDNVEWQTSWAIISADPFLDNMEDMPLDVFEKLRFATERDPENLYVAALYLRARAAKGEQIRREARVLAKRILERSPSSYHGINQLRRLYRDFISKDEAIKLADEYLRRYPDSRYAKKSAAICNKMKVLSPDFTPSRLSGMVTRAISLWEEMIYLYGESNLKDQITLADLYAKVDTEKADHIYRKLLDIEDLDSAEKQMLYHCYARYSFFNKNNSRRSIEYHMEAAKIPVESSYRQTSINELEKTLKRNNYPSKSWKGTQTDPELIEKITKLLTSLQNQIERQNQ